jgi:hypothetical protein
VTSFASFDVLCWLLVGGLALIVFLWFVIVTTDRNERDRYREARDGRQP